ncbi:MAG: LamG domain-containing protein [Bacilli bacterium]|nr:LamG domain-containing protein [Bacilli bacterium]
MGLQVWFPLIKDLRNQGLLNLPAFSLNAFTQEANGKIGQYCYTDRGIIHFTTDFLANKWSLACWVKSTSWSANNDIILCKNASESTSSQFYLSIINGASLNLGINGGSNNGAGGYSYTFATNTWYHIAATYDGANYAMYINGNQVKSGTCTTAKPTGLLNLGIGCRSTNAAGSASTGNANKRLNDVRIYDHCLSQAEVKELSKGLVLHYPLNRSGLGQENFYIGNGISSLSNTSSVSNNGYESTFVLSAQGGVRASNLGFNGKTGPWTASFDIKSSVNTTITIDICDRGYNTATYGTSLTKDVWTHKSFIVTTATNQYNVSGNYNGFIDFNCGAAGTYNIKNLKVEEGIIETPWCPASSSTLGQTININSTTEYDCSGYCNNGIRTGTFSWTSDTPRYSVSQYFVDYTHYIQTPLNGWTPTALTLSCWVKSSNKSPHGNWHIPFNLDGEKAEISVYNNGQFTSGFTIAGTRRTGNFGSIDILNGQWHMLTNTFDGNIIKSYVDGQLIESRNYSGALSSVDYAYLGVFGTRITNYGNTQMYQSDTRLYATALSAEDILELYHTAARIDNVGNTYVYQYIET